MVSSFHFEIKKGNLGVISWNLLEQHDKTPQQESTAAQFKSTCTKQ